MQSGIFCFSPCLCVSVVRFLFEPPGGDARSWRGDWGLPAVLLSSRRPGGDLRRSAGQLRHRRRATGDAGRYLLLRLYPDADPHRGARRHPGAAPHPVLGRAGGRRRGDPVRPGAELRAGLCRAHAGRPWCFGDLHRHAQVAGYRLRRTPLRHPDRPVHADRQPRVDPGRRPSGMGDAGRRLAPRQPRWRPRRTPATRCSSRESGSDSCCSRA